MKSDKLEILSLFDLARNLQITMTHLWVLVLLHNHEPQAKSELAKACKISSAAMTGTLDVLADLKLIDQRILPNDRRQHEVRLSDLGSSIMGSQKLTAA